MMRKVLEKQQRRKREDNNKELGILIRIKDSKIINSINQETKPIS